MVKQFKEALKLEEKMFIHHSKSTKCVSVKLHNNISRNVQKMVTKNYILF